MKNCRDCLHFKACYEMAAANNADEFNTMFAEKCEDFADRSEWVHLPCRVGDTVYTIYNASLSHYKVVEIIINDFVWAKLYNGEYSGEYKSELICLDFSFNEFVFLTREEAEKALERMKENERNII